MLCEAEKEIVYPGPNCIHNCIPWPQREKRGTWNREQIQEIQQMSNLKQLLVRLVIYKLPHSIKRNNKLSCNIEIICTSTVAKFDNLSNIG